MGNLAQTPAKTKTAAFCVALAGTLGREQERGLLPNFWLMTTHSLSLYVMADVGRAAQCYSCYLPAVEIYQAQDPPATQREILALPTDPGCVNSFG